MSNTNKAERINKVRLNMGRIKTMLDAGYTVTEIAEKLGLGEATIRKYKMQIDRAEANKNKA